MQDGISLGYPITLPIEAIILSQPLLGLNRLSMNSMISPPTQWFHPQLNDFIPKLTDISQNHWADLGVDKHVHPAGGTFHFSQELTWEHLTSSSMSLANQNQGELKTKNN